MKRILRPVAPALVLLLLAPGCERGEEDRAPAATQEETEGAGRAASQPVPPARPGPGGEDGGPVVPAAPDAERGVGTFQRYCASCHGTYGDGNSVNAHYMPGIEWSDFTKPSFLVERGKERVLTAILDGGRAVTNGSKYMPKWRSTLSPEQVADLMALIEDFPRRPKPPLSNLSTSDDPGCGTCHMVSGRELVRQTNCAGCHEIDGFERREVAPDLAGAGKKFSRIFLYRFLKEPYNRRQPGYRPMELVRMPDFRLSVDERVALTEFLMSQTALDLPEAYTPPEGVTPEDLARAGDALIDQYGCLGCHKLGKEGGKVGPDLTGIGGGLWNPQWVYNWIRDPLRYFPESPMPKLDVSAEEARTITAALVSRIGTSLGSGEHVATQDGAPAPDGEPPSDPRYPELSPAERSERAAAGERLFRELGCQGCHPLGDLPFDPAKDRVGPRLDSAGHRLQRGWAFDFFWKPIPVRPELAPARMPRIRYTEDEIISVLDYLAEHAEARWGKLREERQGEIEAARGRSDPAEGRRLFVEYDCQSCHRVGCEEFPPVRTPYYSPEETARRRRWAPNLAQDGRLAYWWAFLWIKDPTVFHEEPLMPKIGLSDGEARAILDWLLAEKKK